MREIAGNRFRPDEVEPFLLAGSVPRDWARQVKKASRWPRTVLGRRARSQPEDGSLTMSRKEDEQCRNG
ncbi:hypothetical protein [Mesorhizobium sp. LNHC252B00]|uniref:hypothetical protein n=1 Tax=Mesorhizobium sp. LNHC252B00 TaxID=1287252 RepID=UPI0003F9F947|nr:hypothetical protein [Mesorhizobium sp. LNHC252B00]